MGSRLVLGLCVACACGNARLHDSTDAAAMPDAKIIDGFVFRDAPADAWMWSAPAMIANVDVQTEAIDDETLNSTMTELYFGIVDPTLTGSPKQLWVSTRNTVNDPWGTPTKLDANFNVGAPAAGANVPTEESPRLAPNDLTIYWGRAGDIWYATRSTTTSAWGNWAALAQVNTANYEKWLAVCDSGGNEYFMVSRANSPNGQDLYQGQLGTGLGTGAIVAELNSAQNETSTFLSTDCLTTYFASNRSGSTQIYTAMRGNVNATWNGITVVNDFGMSTDNEDPWVSSDGRTFYFASTRYASPNQANKGVYCSTFGP